MLPMVVGSPLLREPCPPSLLSSVHDIALLYVGTQLMSQKFSSQELNIFPGAITKASPHSLARPDEKLLLSG